MTMNKDSPEVVKFMRLFGKLKDWSEDDPASLSGAKSIDVVKGPRYLWTGFSFNLPTHNAVPTMLVALKNCI
jgi:hypothetical protein